ncbi:MAG TPA: hypothetical protein VJN18_20895 [Polyangiaceae bacterium]|nr:hypothetical protein [Polyangiaceae bacterium]
MTRVHRTRSFERVSIADLPKAATYVFTDGGTEARAALDVWSELRTSSPDKCLRVQQVDWQEVSLERAGKTARVSLRDDSALAAVLRGDPVCIDMSGLPHHVWAPMLRVALANAPSVHVLYVEPAEYRRHTSPASVSLFDLSDGYHGVLPLPGFATLSAEVYKDAVLVAFLGFEGTRARHVAATLDPPPKVVPVIGVPGFRVEFPTVAVACNQEFLMDHSAHANVQLANATCPFEAYDLLREVRRDNPKSLLQIAPVGTKPHALGAVLYAIDHQSGTELIYDNPKRKPNRTQGVGTVHVYTVKEG